MENKKFSNKLQATSEVYARHQENDNRIHCLSAHNTDCNPSPEVEKLSEENIRIENEYDWIDKPFVVNGKTGIKDVLGNIIIPAVFDNYVETYHLFGRPSTIPMKRGEKCGLVKTDGSGNSISDFVYDDIHKFTNLYVVKKENKYGFSQFDGREIMPCIADKVADADCCNFATFQVGNQYGFIDNICFSVIPAIFDEYQPIETEDYIHVEKDGQWGYIAEDGSFTTDQDNAYWGDFQ
jgi:hypothetical protein